MLIKNGIHRTTRPRQHFIQSCDRIIKEPKVIEVNVQYC